VKREPAGAERRGGISPQQALLPNAAFQDAIFKNAHIAGITTDPLGLIQIFNVGAERMLGYAAAEVTHRITPVVFCDPQQLSARAQALSAEFGTAIAADFAAFAFKTSRGIEDSFEWTFIRKDGSSFPSVVSVTALRDPQHAIIGYLLIATDNGASRQPEEALLKNNALLHTIELHYSIVSVADRTGRIIEVNDSFCKISGYSREELLGKTHQIVNSGVHTREFWADIWRSLSTGQQWRGEICNRNKQGALYWEDSIIMPVIADHEQTKYLSISTDITAAKLSEQRLRDAMDKAVEANRAKSEFLANMSHEIRTPMHAVIGLSYLLGQTAMDEQQSALLTKVKFASKSLLAVLNNVLDLSKIEAGELIIEHAVFDLHSLLKELTEMMAVEADTQGIVFVVDATDDLPRALLGDATLLKRVLTNLLANAIKFTERGSVKLVVRQLACTPERVTLSFAVRDTGIGIAPEVQARLFAPFAQADASITRRFGGTGLGLSIVKRLINLVGGEVGLESTPGVGSEFKVVLGFALASADELTRLEASPVSAGKNALLGVRVLAVDDSDINLEVTKRILELEGAQVWLANNGQEALEFLQVERRGVDVVLMDVQMPVLDGYDATRQIRLNPRFRDLPIIALTAGALISERQRATAAGMDDFIIKPFDAETLVESILRNVKPASKRVGEQIDHSPERRAPAAVPWPEIEGIDSSDVRERLNDDVGLFLSLLKRLLDEYSLVSIPAAGEEMAALSAHAGRMHKLRGSASMLGAKAILKLAGEAEAACVAGDVAYGSELAAKISSQLQQTRQSAAPVFLANDGVEPVIPAPMLLPFSNAGRPLGKPESRPAGSTDGKQQTAARRSRILLAEDSEDSRMLVQVYLRGGPYELTCEADGAAAVARFANSDFDLILMDVRMPVMDGLSATRNIRALERERGIPPIPVIALTAGSNEEEIASCILAGCNAHLSKSFVKSDILNAIEKYRRPSTPIAEAIVIEMPQGMEDLVPGYLANRRKEVIDMIELLEARDFAGLIVLSHNLKGTGTGYGFPDLARFGAALEQFAKKADCDSLSARIAELSNYLDRVQLLAKI
jgi:PAS domain S-box-containing protein